MGNKKEKISEVFMNIKSRPKREIEKWSQCFRLCLFADENLYRDLLNCCWLKDRKRRVKWKSRIGHGTCFFYCRVVCGPPRVLGGNTSHLHSPATSVDFEGCGNLRTGAGALNLERLVAATEALTDGVSRHFWIFIICYSIIRIWKRTRVILS